MLVSDFDFDLPEELIAQEAAPRGTARLLMLDRRSGAIAHASIADLPQLLHPGDLLVINDTRVFAARLLGRRTPSGGAVECLLLAPPRRLADGSAEAEALVHPGQKLRPGTTVRFEGAAGTLRGEILERKFFGRRRLRLTVEEGSTPGVEALTAALGQVPLPPYIKRAPTVGDRDRYQTVFAAVPGSVAAPTAGLHFTPEILETLAARGVERATITLHIGYGTFKPVRSATIEEHVVDPEPYSIDADAARRISLAKQEGRAIIAVGTTTTRALEDSASRHGGQVAPGQGDASVFIHPGFAFQIVSGLLTNFHLPQSSLLMLVSAFAGRARVLDAYREAVGARYRFYSYGDAMLIR